MNKPVFIQGENKDRLIIFIHGYLGSPDQFLDLIEVALGRGFSVASILLPGHGGSSLNFAKSRLHDWERHLQSELDRYCTFDHIYLVGHSLGGLLALNASLNEKNRIEKVVLISSPLKVYLLNPVAVYRRAYTMTRPRDSEIKRSYVTANSVERLSFHSLLWLPVLLEPHKLIRRIKKLLPEIKVPTLLFFSKKDETTSWKSAEMFERGLSSSPHEIVLLRHSLHDHFTKDEREIITKKILTFL
jgi:esterase/lipase